MKNKNMGNKKPNKNKAIRILSYFKPYIPQVFACMLLALLVNVAELINPYITKIAIDEYIVNGKQEINILLLGTIYLVAVLSGALFSYVHVIVLSKIVQKIIHDIRIQLFAHIQRMPLSFFDKNSSGRIMTRVSNDVESLNEMYSGVLVALFKDIFMLAGIIFVMLKMNIRMAMISFTVVPLIIIITFLYNKKARTNFKRLRHLIGQINGFLAENISGMKLVQIFHREKQKYKEFERLNNEYNNASMMELMLLALFRPSAELVNSFATSVLIWYCLPWIFDGKIEIGVLFAFISYVKKFFGPIQDLSDKYNVILSGTVSAERIFEIMDIKEGLEKPCEGIAVEPDEVKGEIEFRDVWFSYDNVNWVLKGVSFKINAGETAAFVGATGCGKSTIINLIARFYEIQKGEILLDGINIKDIRLCDLRRCIAVVMQDVFLFTGTVESNIKLRNSNISRQKVEEAAKYANAYEFIQSLPGKFEETVNERGCTFSAGQRQLISFARAIAFDPPVLVLDEATANIDTETELIIQKSLTRISKNRTTLIVAHRLSTIKNADKIIVIHKGRVREIGRHDELMELGGIYKRLNDIQYAQGA